MLCERLSERRHDESSAIDLMEKRNETPETRVCPDVESSGPFQHVGSDVMCGCLPLGVTLSQQQDVHSECFSEKDPDD